MASRAANKLRFHTACAIIRNGHADVFLKDYGSERGPDRMSARALVRAVRDAKSSNNPNVYVRCMTDDALWLSRVYGSKAHNREIANRPHLRERREVELAAVMVPVLTLAIVAKEA